MNAQKLERHATDPVDCRKLRSSKKRGGLQARFRVLICWAHAWTRSSRMIVIVPADSSECDDRRHRRTVELACVDALGGGGGNGICRVSELLIQMVLLCVDVQRNRKSEQTAIASPWQIGCSGDLVSRWQSACHG